MRRLALTACVGVVLFGLQLPATANEIGRIYTCGGLEATQVGTPGRDILRGGDGVDVLVGLGGKDVLFGHNGDDILCGGPGNDVLRGYWDNDTLFGGPGDDFLGGGGWGDGLRGGPGDDFLKGGWRNHWICPDIAYFAPDGGPIVVNNYTSTVTGQGTDKYKDLNAIQGTSGQDVWIGQMFRPHFHPKPHDEKREEYLDLLARLTPIPPGSAGAVSLLNNKQLPMPTHPTQEQDARGPS